MKAAIFSNHSPRVGFGVDRKMAVSRSQVMVVAASRNHFLRYTIQQYPKATIQHAKQLRSSTLNPRHKTQILNSAGAKQGRTLARILRRARGIYDVAAVQCRNSDRPKAPTRNAYLSDDATNALARTSIVTRHNNEIAL